MLQLQENPKVPQTGWDHRLSQTSDEMKTRFTNSLPSKHVQTLTKNISACIVQGSVLSQRFLQCVFFHCLCSPQEYSKNSAYIIAPMDPCHQFGSDTISHYQSLFALALPNQVLGPRAVCSVQTCLRLSGFALPMQYMDKKGKCKIQIETT